MKHLWVFVSDTLVAIQNDLDRLCIGVDLTKERTDDNYYNVHGDSLLLLLIAMPEISYTHLRERDTLLYESLKQVNHVFHKTKLEETDKTDVGTHYHNAFDSMTCMHSRTYLHIGWHFVQNVQKGIPTGVFTCQKQERTNRVCKLGVHEHTNKRVPSIAEEIYRLAAGMYDPSTEEAIKHENLGSHYVDQFVTWYNRRRVTTFKYYASEEERPSRKRRREIEAISSNKKARLVHKRMKMLKKRVVFIPSVEYEQEETRTDPQANELMDDDYDIMDEEYDEEEEEEVTEVTSNQSDSMDDEDNEDEMTTSGNDPNF